MEAMGLIARKVGMTRVVDDQGRMVPVTLLRVEDQKITKQLLQDKNGYEAVQVGYFSKAEKNLNKADIARLRKVGIQDNYSRFIEFRVALESLKKAEAAPAEKAEATEASAEAKEGEEPAAASADTSYKVGSSVGVELLSGVKNLDITGIVKGRGFQGAIRRHGFRTGRRTHGSHFHRRPGSLGCRTTPGRVMKNKKMPGHMGTNKVTIQNLKIVDIDTDARTVAIRGSVPGYRDGYLVIKPSGKKVRG